MAAGHDLVNNRASWGSASYEVQKLFMTNVGDRVVPSTATGSPSTLEPITGAIGLSTWGTAAAYDDVRVTAAGGQENSVTFVRIKPRSTP